MNELSKFSEAELLEEIVRRKNRREQKRPVRFCESCDHFVLNADKDDDDANPCSKGHKMSFRMPENYGDLDNFGFYRLICADRCGD